MSERNSVFEWEVLLDHTDWNQPESLDDLIGR